MEIYSHRGIGLGQENSLASIKEAKRRGLSYEADVRKTQDGVLVLFHDDTLDRVTQTTGTIEEKTYTELEKLGITRLEDALKEDIHFNLDIKEGVFKKGVFGLEVLAMVEQYNAIENVLFTSFYLQTVKDIKKQNNKATIGYITEEKIPLDVLPTIADSDVNYICPHADTLSKHFVQSAHQSGLKVLAWCPSTDEIKKNAIDYQVDGLILNY